MGKNRNIIEVPTYFQSCPGSLIGSISPIENVFISNGYSEIITKKDPKKTDIDYYIEINTIDENSFIKWRLELIKILGERLINTIESVIILNSPLKKHHILIQHMPLYVLYILEYVLKTNFKIEEFSNCKRMRFNTTKSLNCECNKVFESIYNMEPRMIRCSGKLLPTRKRYLSKAYIPVTIIEFQDGKVISFTGYNGPFTITSSFRNSSLLQYEFNNMN